MDATLPRQSTLLVVDDEPGIREVLTLALEAGGHRCVASSNGEEALAIFEEAMHAFHGVITDLHMPVMDGMSLIRQLRWLRPDLHIVVSSGCITDECRQVLQELGVSALLPKPYTAAQLLRCVEPIVRQVQEGVVAKKEGSTPATGQVGASMTGKVSSELSWHPVAAAV